MQSTQKSDKPGSKPTQATSGSTSKTTTESRIAGRTIDKLKDSPIQEQIDEDIESFDDDFEPDDIKEKENRKEELKQQKENKQSVRDYEKRRSTAARNAEEEFDKNDANDRLNELWERVRNCLNDRDPKGEIITVKNQEGSRKRFHDLCEKKQLLYKGINTIKLNDVIEAFAAARLTPMLTKQEFSDLFYALEVFKDQDAETVLWQDLLKAPHAREPNAFKGIFPIVKPKEQSAAELNELKRKKEEADKAKEQEEKELAFKIEEEKKKIQAATKKADSMVKNTGKPSNTKLTKEDQKKIDKTAASLVELQKAEQEQKDKKELEICKQEVADVNNILTLVKNKFEMNEKGLLKEFELADTSRSGTLSITEFMKVISKERIGVKHTDIETIHKLIDDESADRIDYKRMMNVLLGKEVLNLIEIIKKQRIKDGRATGITEEEKKLTGPMSHMPTKDDKISVKVSDDFFSGMSDVMRNSEAEQREKAKFIVEDEYVENTQKIKEMFLEKAFNFEDILAVMGNSKPGFADKVNFDDFSKVVVHYCGASMFSNWQVNRVFQEHAKFPIGVTKDEVKKGYIPIIHFKETFYPGRIWKAEYITEIERQKMLKNKTGTKLDDDNISESMRLSDIMAGKTQGDIDAALQLAEKKKLLEEKRMEKEMANVTATVQEEYDIQSEASMVIDTIIKTRNRDPREVKNESPQIISKGGKKKEIEREERSDYENKEFFQQKETFTLQKIITGNKEMDIAVDNLMKSTADALAADLEIGGVKNKSRLDPGTYVDRYGKERPGFISFNEFKEIYMTHVYYASEVTEKKGKVPDEAKLRGMFETIEQRKLPEDNLHRGVFERIDINNRGYIDRASFINFINSKKPGSFLEKLENKIKKGKERFAHAIQQELTMADKQFGAHGVLPLTAFQTIMVDYGMPLRANDEEELKTGKVLTVDVEGQKVVDYKTLLKKMIHEPKKNLFVLMQAATKIQKVFRGYIHRKKNAAMLSSLADMSSQVQFAGSKKFDSSKAKRESLEKEKAEAAKKKTKSQTRQELAKKKEAQLKAQRLGRRAGQTLENKMAAAVKTQRDPRQEKLAKQRADIEAFIKTQIIEEMIAKAHAYGESLHVCREIQHNYATRPVTKYIYPLMLQFQFNVAGVQPKSLQAMNSLGQIMFLNNANMLQQFDIATTKSLTSVNLGTKPPLKHYDIIDMVCDQRSGRIYTLNANWILEIWNIEQNTSFPQKRIVVCSNEGGKDQKTNLCQVSDVNFAIYDCATYRQTFQNSKPRFLSLQESNQQILVVNTSCVDGSVVFIDPISFSVLKKIQFRYQDFEIPRQIKDSIIHIKSTLHRVQESTGKDIASFFAENIDPETASIDIRKFVDKIFEKDKSIDPDMLYRACRQLDKDNSGSLSLDEFISWTEQVAQELEEEKQAKVDSQLQDEIWPQWVIKEGKLQYAKQLLTRMFVQLETKFSGIHAEQVFGLHDARERGYIRKDEFCRIMKIFFEGVLDEQGRDLEFLLRLTIMTADQMLQYREFCKFLNKRLIRSFKQETSQDGNDSKFSMDDTAVNKRSALELELERPISKEASLSYILKKAAQLQIDLRKEFIRKDPLELSVLPRVQFWNIMISQPLGLNEDELNEVFDNDLNFDNYGNVDYTQIINSDLFVRLEARRIQDKALAVKRVGGKGNHDKNEIEQEMKAADNRKVVVEDLIFIEDLEMIIYSTVAPKTSMVFITSLKKVEKSNQSGDTNQYVNLANLHTFDANSLQQKAAYSIEKKAAKQETMTNHYQLIAKLKGHKNSCPPSICFIPQTGCLISGEKYMSTDHMKQAGDVTSMNLDPAIPPTMQGIKKSTTDYEKYAQRHRDFDKRCEIFIWNLQRDLIELFTLNPPWLVAAHHKFVAHDDSIIDICYLSKSQLLVTSSVDQTIRFWDPISVAYEMTEPNNNPHAMMKPGYYTPLKKEKTKTNVTFKEVKRIYTGQDTACYALRQLIIQDISLNSQCPEIKSQIEWLVALKLPKMTQFEKQHGGKSLQVGFICGYGIERVKIEVPANHHDDIVPPFIIKECEEMISLRRKQLVTAFQTMLPYKIEKIYSQVQLNTSYMEKIRALFMQAILNRKEGKFVNPIPLREIYNIIIKLPTRTKFENFLASTGCADKLSVSETFFYLQKFMQIHPLRTTQIEFEKSIEDFYQRHQRQFLRGIKRWPKAQIQKFANYIRQNGLNVNFLQEPSEGQTNTEQAKVLLKFCTRERFTHYFLTEIKDKGFDFSVQEIEIILNELDPYFTGVIQISSIQRYYSEEIAFYKTVSLNKPKEVIEQIRSVAFPSRKIALQQALMAADAFGDGYIDQETFISAFYLAGVNISRENLEFLFDVMSERFVKGQGPDRENKKGTLSKSDLKNIANSETKYLNLLYFFGKIFQKNERREVTEVDETLSLIKAALIYKGVDFSIIFAETSEEDPKKAGKKSKSIATKDEKIDMMCHYTRFAQQMVKSEFCERLNQIKATGVTEDRIRRLANYLSLNQKNQAIVYLNSWLHHLKRVQTAFNIPDPKILPIICSKLLHNEVVFRSWVDTICLLKQKREEDKFIEQADLRSVLRKFGVNYINQSLFLNEFTRGVPVHIDDLITLMKSCKNSAFASDEKYTMAGFGFSDLQDVKSTDFFQSINKKIQKHSNIINRNELIEKFREFDPTDSGLIKIPYLVQVLNHSLPQVFDQKELIGLQYELECLNYDQQCDYNEFIEIFFKNNLDDGPGGQDDNLKLKLNKTSYTLQDYEDLLSRISAHVNKDDLPIDKVFAIYWKNGFITYAQMRQIFQILDFPLTEKEFDILILYADENNQQSIHAHELLQQIRNAEQYNPQFDMLKWIYAARDLNGKVGLLEQVMIVLPQLNEQIELLQSRQVVSKDEDFSGGKEKDAFSQHLNNHNTHDASKCNSFSKVITGDFFQEMLRREIPKMSEPAIELVTKFAIKGSKRQTVKGEKSSNIAIDINRDLIQFKHFEMAIDEVIHDLKKEEIKRIQKEQEALLQLTDAEMLRRDFEQAEERKKRERKPDPQRQQRETQLINKITDIFRQREISFYDAFQEDYDPLKTENLLQMSRFKDKIKSLNLPLTVQDHRILRRMADPQAIGKVNINTICERFDTVDLRKLRLNKVLDRVATAFFIQNFNLRKAFALFDANGDGLISRRELMEGFTILKLGLTYNEIDDLMSIMSTRNDQMISYDDFIVKMDVSIAHRKELVQDNIEESLMKKINDCLEYSGETLEEAMQTADYNDEGSILKEDLQRVFKRIGLSTIEQNMPLILEIGGITEKQERVDIRSFALRFNKKLKQRIQNADFAKKMFIHKVYSMLRAKELSLFDVFVRMDVNKSGCLTKIELKTGIQSLGIVITQSEMDMLWKSIMVHVKKKPTEVKEEPSWKRTLTQKNRCIEEDVSYNEFILTFVDAGCIKFEKSTDNRNTLINKYRSQLQRLNLNVEKAYRMYDDQDVRFVFKNDFIDISNAHRLEFTHEELEKIFEIICEPQTKIKEKMDMQALALDPVEKKKSSSRFTYQQFKEAISVKLDENWIFQAYIKIHSVVLQKSLTYKRLFTQWKDSKKSRTAAGRLTAPELIVGLKKLKAGLTNAEINRLVEGLQFDGKDQSIGFKEFEDKIKTGAATLETEQSFERMLLIDWIMQFNEMMTRSGFPFEKLFQDQDKSHKGSLTFEEFLNMNQFIGVSMVKKELHRVFIIIDKSKEGRIDMQEVKNISNLTWKEQPEDDNADGWLEEEENLQGNDMLIKEQVNDIYEEVKNKLETKNTTLEQVAFTDLQMNQHMLVTAKGLQTIMDKLSIVVSAIQTERIIKDLRKSNNNKFECTLKDFIDYMNRRRINVAFLEKGSIDPLLASATNAFISVKDLYNLTFDQLFLILCGSHDKNASISKEDFMINIQGMELKLSVEEINNFFNQCDEKNTNRISRAQFINNITFINSRIGGSSHLEAQLTKGALTAKKGQTNTQAVLQVINILCDGIQTQKLNIRQLALSMDINGTGFVSRPEFVTTCQQLSDTVTLDQIRVLQNYLDDKNTGKVSIMEFLRVCTDTLNTQIGGGVFSFMQVQPIIQKIINELSVDCDRFFDEVAEANEKFNENEREEKFRARALHAKTIAGIASNPVKGSKQTTENEQCSMMGLSKTVFFRYLTKYGVILKDHEKALISTVFGMQNQDRDKLDYNLIDSAFEGIQQQLYNKEIQYTSEWERRIFKKIGNYLMQNNKSISECFDNIDLSRTATVDMNTLKSAIIRFQLNLHDKELKTFIERIDSHKRGYITKNEFIQRFWSAYTYDETYLDEQESAKERETALQMDKQKDGEETETKIQLPEVKQMLSHNIIEASKKLRSEMEEKVKQCKAFGLIQRKIKRTMPVQEAFKRLDTNNNGYLVLRDFHINFSNFFDLSLRNHEVRNLFQEIDTDHNGILLFAELENFFKKDYVKEMKELEIQREQTNTQNEIFDHMIKILVQRGLSLQDVFNEIDTDKSGFIDVEEFHDLLERMGFTITQSQVYEILTKMDKNFDGRISYDELRTYIEKLGFNIKEIESRGLGYRHHDAVEFMWRDKAIELIIRTFYSKLGKKVTYEEYFTKYDQDHDAYLAPSEFRKSLMDLKEPQLKQSQIERIMHILIEEKKLLPLISIDRVAKFLSNYKYLDIPDGGNNSVLIDEDLFCYIVEKYDGISRLMELSLSASDKSNYISRHIYELNSRGLHMMSNQRTVQILGRKTNLLNNMYNNTMVLLANEVNRLVKEEAQMCVLDPTHNIDTIVSDQNIGVLTSVSLPTIENSSYDVDYSSVLSLPCGALRYQGKLVAKRQPIEVLLYPSDILQYVSLDGKSYKTHLALELQVHRYLMGARFEEEDEFTEEEIHNMDIVMNIGKFEKKIGLAMNEKEIYVINNCIDMDQWINLDEFVHTNGGILNIPLFYHTDAPLFIIRHWAKLILELIHKVHDISIVLRCLNTRQLWISRDGQRIKLGHTRGVGRINNLGFIMSCSDIYLNLENNSAEQTDKQSSGFAPSKGHNSSSRKTEGGRTFSNVALDDPFLAPEILFSKFQDHTAAIDVWAFGMIMYCLLFGKKPASYYQVYRDWFKKSHGNDVEMQSLPFIPPSQRNFLYDPFSIDFEMPFDKVDMEQLVGKKIAQAPKDHDFAFGASTDHLDLNGDFNFGNFMKCIKNLSYSSMFADENSKKFSFKALSSDQCKEQLAVLSPPRFAGQAKNAENVRKKLIFQLAQSSVLERKNELGLILDLISSCLDVDPKKRPTITGLLHSPIFRLDHSERTNAERFSQNVILYRSPQVSVSLRITEPLRLICEHAIQNPMSLYDREEVILKLFAYTEDCINHISSMPIEEINSVLTENERRKGILEQTLRTQFKDKNFSQLRVSPNSPIAAQVIEDKVVDMLLFVTLRYMKNFNVYKQKKLKELETFAQTLENLQGDTQSHSKSHNESRMSKSAGQEGFDRMDSPSKIKANRQELLKKQTERLQNHVIGRMAHMLKLMVYEMHSYNTPLAPFVEDIIRYIVKFFLGEEADFGSDVVLRKTSHAETGLQEYLRGRSFFRREAELNEHFKSDNCDKLWHLEQKNLQFLDKSNYWCLELHKEALKIFKDAITESGMGQSCYPVINDYIQNVTNSFEPTKIFSQQMNQLSLSFLIPMHRTAAYYNELIPLTESLSRLYDENLEKAGKRCSLAMIRSVFQTGNSDKIKACLDLRVPKHIIHFLQDNDAEIRKECLLILLEISKGLQDEDFELLSKNAVNMKQEFSKHGFSRTAFDKHKAMSMAAQQEVLDPGKIEVGTGSKKRGQQGRQKDRHPCLRETEESQTDQICNFIKRTIALIEKNENERYINFALDLPNLNFLSSKRFLKEMAICYESPVFIAPLIRLLKNPEGVEQHTNKMIILELIQNLVCGNERVLIAINSPACDTYMTLLKMLMQSTKMTNARQELSSLNAKMRYQIQLQDKAIDLFKFVFEQQRPTIIRDIKCIGAASTLLREQNIPIPDVVNLPDLMEFFDKKALATNFNIRTVNIEKYVIKVKQLRCWIKHFYKQSTIPELTRIKALQRCMNFLIKVTKLALKEFFEHNITADSPTKTKRDEENEEEKDYKLLIKTNLSLFDWICVQNKMQLMFNEECGRTNLDFVISTCNLILGQFRKPIVNVPTDLNDADKLKLKQNKMPPMEDLAFNDKQNRRTQFKRKYEIFPLTDIGSILQNIQYQLVRANNPFINQLLSEANFGFVFGEQLLLEFDFVRHCIDNCVESMVLIDSYVKKNEIRLNTFEYLLRSHEHTLKDQFIKSNFCERLFLDYVGDFREFNIQFSKIDLEFLAFRRSFPLRLEAISMLNTGLMLKANAPQVYTEMLMYARRHFLVRREMNLIQHGGMTNREATTLLLFAIIVESNEEDLIYVMVQEGVHRQIRNLMKDYPSLNKRFPVLAQFINRF